MDHVLSECVRVLILLQLTIILEDSRRTAYMVNVGTDLDGVYKATDKSANDICSMIEGYEVQFRNGTLYQFTIPNTATWHGVTFNAVTGMLELSSRLCKTVVITIKSNRFFIMWRLLVY